MKHLEVLKLVPFAYIIGMIYLLTFWSSFGINPIEHASFFDVMATAIMPMTPLVLLFAYSFMFFSMYFIRDIVFRGFFKSDTPKVRVINFILASVSSIFVVVVSLQVIQKPFIWYALFSLAFPFFIPLYRSKIFSNIESDHLRRFATLAVICLPLLSFSQAKIDSYNITNEIIYMEANIENKTWKYLGRIGDSFFFTGKLNEDVLIASQQDLSTLILTKVRSGGHNLLE